jgi:hypothetical protein
MRRFSAITVLVASFLTLLALPMTSSGQSGNLVDELLKGVNQSLENVRSTVQGLTAPQGGAQAQGGSRGASPGSPGGYNPPLHGTNPHGNGTAATIDLPASPDRPLGSDPAGTGDEAVVVGRSVSEQQANGDYHSHITIVALPLLSPDLEIGVDAAEGQTSKSPLDPLQTTLLDGLCDGTANAVCLSVLKADATATNTSASSNFSVATAQLGGPTGISAGAVSSSGSTSQDSTCQSATGGSNVANANLVTLIRADAISSGTSSKACTDNSTTQTATGNVVNLNEAGIPLPLAAECGTGALNATGLIPGVAEVVCNADEKNAGQGVTAFPTETYGIHEGLSAFVLGSLTKLTTAASESKTVASPSGPGNTPPGTPPGGGGGGGGTGGDDDQGGAQGERDNTGGGGTQCSDGVDNDGDGRTDFPDDPGCSSAADDSEGGSGGTQCSDGVDNDGDGRIDFPNDPGCASAADDSEAGDGSPQCSDGIDNDGDGKVDFPNDPQCSSAQDDSEADAALALTGANLLLTVLVGVLVLLAGLKLREATGRLERGRS